MKNSIIFCFILTIALFTTACEKQQILPKEEFHEFSEIQFAHLNLPSTVTMMTSYKPFSVAVLNEIIDQKNFQTNIDRNNKDFSAVDIDKNNNCENGTCDTQLKELGMKLQKQANESCETKWGEVACCTEGFTTYIMVMVEPKDIDCLKNKKATNEDVKGERKDTPYNETKLIPVGILAQACFVGKEFTLIAINKETSQTFDNNRRYGIDWFNGDDYIGSGEQIGCISGKNITVIVKDHITGSRGSAIIELPYDDKIN